MEEAVVKSAVSAASPGSENYTQDLAELVSGMSRFLTLLVVTPPFSDAKMGLAEWSVLNLIGKSQTVSQKQVAAALGITRQRASQITDLLLTASLISVKTSREDARQKDMMATDRGVKELAKINASLEAMLTTSLKNKERALASANRIVNRHLLRAIRQPRTEAQLAAIRKRQSERAKAGT